MARKWIEIDHIHPVVNDNTNMREVQRMTERMRIRGFNTQHPITVIPAKQRGEYILIDGRHRRMAARRAGLHKVFAVVVPVDQWYPSFDPKWFVTQVVKPARKKGWL